jgi:signal transduction histidine kinase
MSISSERQTGPDEIPRPMTRRRELALAAIVAREHERRRLAAELHDSTGANIAAARLNLLTIDKSLPPDRESERTLLAQALELLTEASTSIRTLCRELRPAVLDRFDLAHGIRHSAERFSRSTGIVVELDLQQTDRPCGAEVDLMLLRIAQEALENCARHSGATRVSVSLRREGTRMVFTIADDGVGFDPGQLAADADGTGIGLLNMLDRASVAGASFRVDSAPGRGTRVIVEC